MEYSNVEPDEWWELAKAQLKKEMEKNLVAHMRDVEGYRGYLSAFKKKIPDFIYRIINSLKHFNPTKEVREAEYNGMAHDK
jgi:hypothetical protein